MISYHHNLLDAYLKEGWGAITKNYKEQKMPISPGKNLFKDRFRPFE